MIERAATLLALTSEDTTNLEASLYARSVHPRLRVTLRLFDDRFATAVYRTLRAAHPGALTRSRSVTYLAAPAFAGAMMGREILGAIPVERRVLLIARFAVRGQAALEGRTVAEVLRPGRLRVLAVDTSAPDDPEPDAAPPPPRRRRPSAHRRGWCTSSATTMSSARRTGCCWSPPGRGWAICTPGTGARWRARGPAGVTAPARCDPAPSPLRGPVITSRGGALRPVTNATKSSGRGRDVRVTCGSCGGAPRGAPPQQAGRPAPLLLAADRAGSGWAWTLTKA